MIKRIILIKHTWFNFMYQCGVESVVLYVCKYAQCYVTTHACSGHVKIQTEKHLQTTSHAKM